MIIDFYIYLPISKYIIKIPKVATNFNNSLSKKYRNI